MRNFVLGIIVTLVVIGGGACWYFIGGHAPVTPAESPMLFETWLAKSALNARIHQQMPTTVPVAADAATYAAAVPVYRQHCAVCHGLPNQQAEIFATMFPQPTQLFAGTGVSDNPAGETYWKVTNGIRLSGMPAFDAILNDTQRWQLSVLLAHSNQLPPPLVQQLAAPLPQTP